MHFPMRTGFREKFQQDNIPKTKVRKEIADLPDYGCEYDQAGRDMKDKNDFMSKEVADQIEKITETYLKKRMSGGFNIPLTNPQMESSDSEQLNSSDEEIGRKLQENASLVQNGFIGKDWRIEP